jgi:hypothetical protein
MPRAGLLLLLGASLGCHAKPAAQPLRSGAAEVAQGFLEALRQGDWQAAYDRLDPQVRASLSRDEFAGRAKAYCLSFGFQPVAVQVRSCEERDHQAIAHVSFLGLAGSSPRFFKDAVALARGADGWSILLRDNFGLSPPTQLPDQS